MIIIAIQNVKLQQNRFATFNPTKGKIEQISETSKDFSIVAFNVTEIVYVAKANTKVI